MPKKQAVPVIPVIYTLQVLPMRLVHPNPNQPRQDFDEDYIKSLAANIQTNGLLYEVYIRSHPEKPGEFVIAAGECRWRALDLLGVEEFTFRVLAGDVPAYIISMIENECRRPINIIERADSYAQCLSSEPGMTVAKLAERTGNSTNEVYRILRIAALPPQIKKWVSQGKLRQGNIADLNQFRSISAQIRFAQQLIAGENPPEIDEANVRTSQRSERQIESWLPKTPDALIRRFLDVRHRTKALPHIARAFMNLTPTDQEAGFKHFTAETRRILTEALRENAKVCGELVELFERIPATNLLRKQETNSDISTSKSKPNHGVCGEGDEDQLDPNETDVDFVLPARSLSPHVAPIPPAAPVLASRGVGNGREVRKTNGNNNHSMSAPALPHRPPVPENGNGAGPKREPFQLSTRPPSWDVIGSHDGRLKRYNGYLRTLFLGPERFGKVSLSNARFRSISATGDESQEAALGSIRAMRAVWDFEPSVYTGERKNFIECVLNIRTVLGPDLTFEQLMNKIWQQDKTRDPINLPSI